MVSRTLKIATLVGVLSLFSLFAGGCSAKRVHRLTDFEYGALPADANVDVYIGKSPQAHDPIAIVDSERYEGKDDAAKQLMLEDLKKRARALGADALQDVRLLPIKVRGFVLDEQVPISAAVKQGRYELYFLRAEAVKYVEPVELPPSSVNIH